MALYILCTECGKLRLANPYECPYCKKPVPIKYRTHYDGTPLRPPRPKNLRKELRDIDWDQ